MYRNAQYGNETFLPIRYNEDICIGCNRCVDACQVDVLLPSNIKGQHPELGFPSECWYCGSCVSECALDGAISLVHPLMNQVQWVEKKSLLGGRNK